MCLATLLLKFSILIDGLGDFRTVPVPTNVPNNIPVRITFYLYTFIYLLIGSLTYAEAVSKTLQG